MPEEQDHARSADDRPEEVVDPAELIRIGTMTKAMLEEASAVTLDEAGRHRLAEIHRRAVDMVKEAVSPGLRDELSEFALPLGDGDPSEPELRLAQAQLIGWLNGLLMGVQAAAFNQLRRGELETAAGEQARRQEDAEQRRQSAYL